MPTAPDSSPCLDCGMCCDGTLYSFVYIKASERARVDRIGGDHARFNDRPAFREPCPALCGRACSIYADRFETCRQYRCATLVALDAAQIDTEEAMRRICQATDAAARVRDALAPGQTFQTARDEWAHHPEDQRASREGARLHLLLTALEMLLSRYFRRELEDRLTFAVPS